MRWSPRNSPQKHVWRAKVVLLTADGHGTAEIAAMAAATGISVSSVQRIWRAHGLQPHRVRQFTSIQGLE